MTWPTPPPSTWPYGPSPTPVTPTAPLGALTLGDLFSATLATYRRKFWLFLWLSLVPNLVLFVVIIAAVIATMLVIESGTWSQPSDALTVLGIVLAAFVPLVLLAVYTMVLAGRTSVATIDLATGRGEPTWATLRERTRGLGGRVLLLYLGGAALTMGVLLAVGLVIAFAVFATLEGRTSRGDMGAFVGLAVLFFFVLFPVTYAVSVKLLYTLVAMAEEGLGPLAALGRSWQMTGGAFWRTLGYYLTASIVVGAAGGLVQFALMPLSVLPPARDMAGAWVSLIISAVAILLTLAASALVTPFSTIWCALMYLGRRREQAGQPVLPRGAWYPPAAYPPGQP